MLLGVHCSVAGGVLNAFNEVHSKGLDTFQIFTKNQRQWKEKIIEAKEGNEFKAELKKSKIKYAFSHSTYLINLASCEDLIRKKSILALSGELRRCDALGLNYTVLHPGACKGISEAEGIQLVSEALNVALTNTKGMDVKILLENTAGQGSALGWKFEQLYEIMDRVGSDRLGICFDTCHAFAAGYDIRTKTGFEHTMALVDKHVGLNRLFVFHINDSKGDLGSRIDRHEHIGKGKIGLEPFRKIMHQFKKVPKIIELPKEMDKTNLEVLRGL